MMDFDTWWRTTGQLDEAGKDDWRVCWDAAVATERERLACERDRLDRFEDWLSDRSGPLLHIDNIRDALAQIGTVK